MDILSNKLKLKRLGINTQEEYVVYMRSDCYICISEGFAAMTRIEVNVNGENIIATLNTIDSELLHKGEAGLSNSAWRALAAKEGDMIAFSHLQPVDSMSFVRAKMYGINLDLYSLHAILKDIKDGKYSNIELSAFVTACAGDSLNLEEIIALTKVMVDLGRCLKWDQEIVVDKHCIGGLPGNRTSPIVVAIIAALGLTIPKTSSRAITSPAGTADTMEMFTNVDLSLKKIQEVVNKEGGCIAWGGAVALSPTDDIIIKIERALDIDSEGQMIASVLSKKVAAGSTHVVIDIPVGPTAKVRSESEAEKLKYYFSVVAKEVGLNVKVLITDGTQPVGRGIGPALEALDVLSVLKNEIEAPEGLKDRAVLLAGEIIELSGFAPVGEGQKTALEVLESQKAYSKFISICEAQGGFKIPEVGKLKHEVLSAKSGVVHAVDNRRLSKLAKLSGAPNSPGAGVLYLSPIGKKVRVGDPLFVIFASSKGELAYALEYLKSQQEIVKIQSA